MVKGGGVQRWMNIQPGQVVRTPAGRLRIVRRVSPAPPKFRGTAARKTWVYFAIARQSWTTRPYTLYSVCDLIQLGYKLVDRVVKLNGQFDRMLAEDTRRCEGGMAKTASELNFRAKDVIGIP